MQVFLIGFMGSGKTHTGQRLANLLSRPFYDLDEEIERFAGNSISAIFQEAGEGHFRKLERDCLRSLGTGSKAVIACGGGTPCFYDNMRWMNAQGLSIYLRCPVPLLAQRLRKGQAHRPLIRGLRQEQLEAFIGSKLAARSPFYMQANVVYDQESPQEDVATALYHQFSNIIGH